MLVAATANGALGYESGISAPRIGDQWARWLWMLTYSNVFSRTGSFHEKEDQHPKTVIDSL